MGDKTVRTLCGQLQHEPGGPRAARLTELAWAGRDVSVGDLERIPIPTRRRLVELIVLSESKQLDVDRDGQPWSFLVRVCVSAVAANELWDKQQHGRHGWCDRLVGTIVDGARPETIGELVGEVWADRLDQRFVQLIGAVRPVAKRRPFIGASIGRLINRHGQMAVDQQTVVDIAAHSVGMALAVLANSDPSETQISDTIGAIVRAGRAGGLVHQKDRWAPHVGADFIEKLVDTLCRMGHGRWLAPFDTATILKLIENLPGDVRATLGVFAPESFLSAGSPWQAEADEIDLFWERSFELGESPERAANSMLSVMRRTNGEATRTSAQQALYERALCDERIGASKVLEAATDGTALHETVEERARERIESVGADIDVDVALARARVMAPDWSGSTVELLDSIARIHASAAPAGN